MGINKDIAAVEAFAARVSPLLTLAGGPPYVLYAGALLALGKHAEANGALDLFEAALRAALPLADAEAPAPVMKTISIEATDTERQVVLKLAGLFRDVFEAMAQGTGKAMALNALVSVYISEVTQSGRTEEAVAGLRSTIALLEGAAAPQSSKLATAAVRGNA